LRVIALFHVRQQQRRQAVDFCLLGWILQRLYQAESSRRLIALGKIFSAADRWHDHSQP
jgi:hypothetical protein